MFFSRNWLSATIEEFVAALDAYIHWYNEARIKMSLGFRSPTEHRRSLGIAEVQFTWGPSASRTSQPSATQQLSNQLLHTIQRALEVELKLRVLLMSLHELQID